MSAATDVPGIWYYYWYWYWYWYDYDTNSNCVDVDLLEYEQGTHTILNINTQKPPSDMGVLV